MHMAEVTICYGMTETSPVSTQTRKDDSLELRTSTVGRAHPHVEVLVADPDTGLPVDTGTAGELCTRGYSVMIGYWDEPERTAEVLRRGWMHTGDLATMDDDGYVNIVGRIKDMVIRGGENVYPRDIVDAQVIGVPDEKYGEELMAWVRLREGAALDADALREFCAGRLAHYKIPRYLHVVDEFPMTVTGKVRKVQMREAAIDILGLESAAAAKHA
jgi:fatty-acyl-CoA synthase